MSKKKRQNSDNELDQEFGLDEDMASESMNEEDDDNDENESDDVFAEDESDLELLRKHEEEGLLRIERKEARKEDRKEAAAAEPAKGKTNIERVMLTTKGVDVSNYVFADFLL